MPHRHQELVPLCRVCKEIAPRSCLRCGAPLCDEHAPGVPDRRCDSCEETFRLANRVLLSAARGRRPAKLTPRTVGIFGALLGVFVVPVFVGAVLAKDAGTALVAGLVVSVLGVIVSRIEPTPKGARRKLQRARSRFLATRAAGLDDEEE